MTKSTKRLFETWIRLLKGCLKAAESWLREQPIEDGPDQKPADNPSA